MGKSQMIYLDSNVFINAILYDDVKGQQSRNLLSFIQAEQPAATSALTFDEVNWIVRKAKGLELSLIASKNLLEIQNLEFLDVNITILWKAYNIIKEYGIAPRDAIHAACAISNNIAIIVSEDEHFDNVKELKRKTVEQVLRH